ncbi:hypothetical protein BKA57DRAFT_534855 [Linnemannia elongata]|nr:hypothetical protein BKA57DRAFT_534855 [Linnemannia elongata]
MVSPFAFARQHHSAAKLMIFFSHTTTTAMQQTTKLCLLHKQNKTKQQAIVSCKQLPTLFCYSFFFLSFGLPMWPCIFL